jgi:RNA polymerase sigma factor (sigma-70 family)
VEEETGMRTEALQGALRRLSPVDGGLSDCQLLARFIDGRDESAFAALLNRHGPAVLGVCRRVLGNEADAEDAFQATFLILARRARSVVRREAVGAFLYGVAYRTAVRAREKACRRRAVEMQVEKMPHPEVPPAEMLDWRPALDRELSLLQEKYRAALLLCDLEGRTRREAATQLGVPEGTVASRLATARRMLARRLAQCGVTLSASAMAVALAEDATAAVSARLVTKTVESASLVAAGAAVPAAAPAVALMNDVLRSMLMNKLKTCAGAVLAVAVIIGVGVAHRADGQTPGPAPRGQASAGEERPVTELELLRREVDILKMQVQLLQGKQRAQDAEMRALKGRDGAAGARFGSELRGYVAPDDPTSQGPRGASVQGGPDPDVVAPRVGGGNIAPAGQYTRAPSSSTALPPSPIKTARETTPASPTPSAIDPTAPEGTRAPSANEHNPFRDRTPTRASTATQDLAPRNATPAVSAGSSPRAADNDMDAAAAAFLKVFRNADEAAKRRALDLMEKAMKELQQQGAPASRPK